MLTRSTGCPISTSERHRVGLSSTHVAVLNYSAKPLSLQLYATDAINTSTGGFGLLPAGTSKPVGAGSWISLPAKSATVKVPAQTANAPGMVIVPFTCGCRSTRRPATTSAASSPRCRQWERTRPARTSSSTSGSANRLFIRVAGTLAPKLTISGLHATYHGTSTRSATAASR